MKHTLTDCRLLLFLFLFSMASVAQTQHLSSASTQNMSPKEMRKQARTVLSSKLHLLVAHDQRQKTKTITALVADAEMDLPYHRGHFLSRHNGEIGVKIITQNVATLIPHLEKIGMDVSAIAEKVGIIEGYIAVDKILLLNPLKDHGLVSADIMYRPITHVGSVTTQSDSLMGTDQVRMNNPGTDGTGVKVGTMSDSYDNLGGEAAGIASGDLPNDVVVIEDLPMGGSDEGRALCEIVHDIAPGADLFFATAGLGQASFATNIQMLADAGCTVIVDDVGYFAEPFFQDGIIAQKIDEVTTVQNVSYYSAAGNMADNSYESTNINIVSPTVSPFGGLGDYDFDQGAGTDVFQQITLGPGEEIALSLQWDDPFFTATGVDTDLDIFLFDDPPVNIIAESRDDNLLNQSPVEVVIHINPGPGDQILNVLITKSVGPDPGRIKYVNFAATHDPQEYDTNSPTIVGHPAAEHAIAVVAAFFGNNVLEPFNSIGPATILFDPDGTPSFTGNGSTKSNQVPVTRNKPDITSHDGVNNTFFGNDIAFDADIFPNFFGTSAAAPHAAGAAALRKSRLPNLTEDLLRELSQLAADDLGISGRDNSTGFGGDAPMANGTQDQIIFTDGFESGDTSVWTEGANRSAKDDNHHKAGGPNNDIRTIIAINRVSSDRQEDIDLIFMSGNTLDLRANFEVQAGRTFELIILDFLQD